MAFSIFIKLCEEILRMLGLQLRVFYFLRNNLNDNWNIMNYFFYRPPCFIVVPFSGHRLYNSVQKWYRFDPLNTQFFHFIHCTQMPLWMLFARGLASLLSLDLSSFNMDSISFSRFSFPRLNFWNLIFRYRNNKIT